VYVPTYGRPKVSYLHRFRRVGWGRMVKAVTVLLTMVTVVVLTACGSSAVTATARVTRLSSSCLPPAFNLFGPRRPLPKELATPLEAKIRSRFAIFRRPALPGEEPAGLNLAAGGLRSELYEDYELSGYYPAYVRRLTRLPAARRYFVIPAYGRSEVVVAAHCLAAGKSERHVLVEEQHRRLVEPVDCIIEVGGGENASPPGCEPFAAIDEAGRVFQPDLHKESIVELVPDGVSSVRIDYRETPPIVVPVSENAFWFTSPPPTSRVEAELKRLEPAIVTMHLTRAQRRRSRLQWDEAVDETEPTKIEWLNNAGRLVRTISPPTAASISGTSVGDLRAPIESTTTLKRSRSSTS
jgi:hypothetical protein